MESKGVPDGLYTDLRPHIAFHTVLRCSLQKLLSTVVFGLQGGKGSQLPLHLRHGAEVLQGPSLRASKR